MIKYTYGTIPSFQVFDSAFEKEVGWKAYEIRNCRFDVDGDYSSKELYSLVEKLSSSDKEEDLDLASCILQTLGIEWI